VISRICKRSVVLGVVAAALLAPQALAVPVVDGEFPVPEIGTNDKIVEGPDGNMWMTLSEAGKDVARISPAGAVTSYDLEAVTASGIAVGPEGKIWITRNGDVIRFDAADPEGSKVPTPVAEIGTSHSIVQGPDGNMWVATDGKVLQLQASDPSKVKPFPVAGLAPKDIDVAGPLLAVADSGAEPRVVTLTTAGDEVDYPLPGGSQGVAGTSTGLISFSQQGNTPEQVGLISPPTAQPLIETPGGIGDPFGAALGSDEAFWFAMSGNDGVARLTQDGSLTLLNGFAKESFPRQLAAGPGNTLWVTLDMIDKVGRISGLEPPVAGPPPPRSGVARPRTRIKSGPKGKVRTRGKRRRVKFRFHSPDAGARFQCRLVRLKKKASASKAPRFRGCKSPKAYRLRPGRYRFEVRAVLAGVVDPTPAKRGFRIVRVRAK
jgi:virginiamycin B lyase